MNIQNELFRTYYAALVQVVQLLEDVRNDHVRYQSFFLGKQPITKSLHEKFTLLQKLLEDYSLSSNDDHEAGDDLERRIRDAAHQAQDIIESRISEEKTKEPHTRKKFLYKLIHVKRPQHQRDDDQEVCYEGLQRVEEEIGSILDELAMIKESYIKVKDFVDIGSGSKQALARSTTMVGFNEHVIRIKEKLCGGSSQLQTIPITGMGGIGKTTLARNIFDDKLIVDYFDVCLWVTVSQDYNNKNMLRVILDSIKTVSQESLHELSFTQLSVDIHKQLRSRRYLLIIDDIWSTNVLDDLKRISPENSNGSRIIITTRLSDVAVYATNFGSPLHQMQFLNEEQSWHLFQEKVFSQEEGRACPPELEDPGKSIVHNCRGLPLAIVVIAGVLSKVNRTRTDWNEIASNVNSVVAKNDEHFSRIFSLSYNHLPHHLKPCFLYIGGFPEDHEISVSHLIKLWMAEGFLNNNPALVEELSSSKRRSLEEVGEEYLEDLVKRNLILITKRQSYNGKISDCGIHDLLRDLCQQKARNENFFHVTGKNGYLPEEDRYQNSVRRACLYPYDNDSSPRIMTIEIPDSTARSILCFEKQYAPTNNNRKISLGCFKLLRVFDALQIKFKSFPEKLVVLFHLRYLALYIKPRNFIFNITIRIPSSIAQLQNLQTFIVKLKYDDQLSLPSEMWKMAQLRHVFISSRLKLPSPRGMHSGVHLLGNLQTLTKVINYRFTEEAVAMMPNLKILRVCYTKPENRIWEMLNNLSNLHQLVELQIKLHNNFPTNYNSNYNSNFAFPHNVKKLTLGDCKIPWERMSSLVGYLPNLEVLEITNWWHTKGSFQEWEPKEGEFRSLKSLLINDQDLMYWRADQSHFPRLVQLQLYFCKRLEKIPMEIGDISTLELIELNWCSDSIQNSARLIQQQQEDMGNDTLQVRIVKVDEPFIPYWDETFLRKIV